MSFNCLLNALCDHKPNPFPTQKITDLLIQMMLIIFLQRKDKDKEIHSGSVLQATAPPEGPIS